MTNLTLYPASPRGIFNLRFLLNKFSFNFIVALHIIHLSKLLLIFTSFLQLLLVPFSKFLVVADNVLVVYALAQHAFAPVLPQTFCFSSCF